MDNKFTGRKFKAAFLLLLLFCCLSISWRSDKNSPTTMIDTGNFQFSLSTYGKHIFERESCIGCHVLDQSEKQGMISLDGIGNKYPPDWHFTHLMDPRSMIYDSEMPSYEKLNNQSLSKDSLLIWFGAQSSNNWDTILMQADTLQQVLTVAEAGSNSHTEMQALIAYLMSIPASKELEAKIAVESARQKEEDRIWDSLLVEPDGILFADSDNKNSIESGSSLFSMKCSMCHGASGGGLVGPNLTDEYWLHGGEKKDVSQSIIYGNSTHGMISWRFQLSHEQVHDLVCYIWSIRGTTPPNAKAPQGEKKTKK
ncbi:MAG: c-type cytochrome [Bacteroidia bacterium]